MPIEGPQRHGLIQQWFRSHLVQLCVCLMLMSLAAWARFRGLPAMGALQDSVGPYWAAVRLDGRAHAEPYGFLQVLPYIVSVHVSGTLWDAFQVLAFFHSSVAVVAALACLKLCPGRWPLALCVGAVVALDPGLIDTALSGSKTYLAAVFVGAIPFVGKRWTWVCWAFAVANHPLAVATLPLVGREGFSKPALPGLVFAVAAVGLQASGWQSAGVGDGGSPVAVLEALGAFVQQGGWTGWLVLGGPVLGLWSRRTRNLAGGVLVSMVALFLLGAAVGYLRDHHIRMLTIPALVCWAALPGVWISILLLFVRIPPHPVFPAGLVDREGTIGLAHRAGELLNVEEGPLVVDGAWFSGSPAMEPSAVMMDLFLRGWLREDLRPGADVVVIVSSERGELPDIPPDARKLMDGDRYRVFRAAPRVVRSWSAVNCSQQPRLGGAWDAISVLHRDTDSARLKAWWACN